MPPPDPSTHRIPRQGGQPGPTERIPAQRPPGPGQRPGFDAPTEKIRQPPPPGGYPPPGGQSAPYAGAPGAPPPEADKPRKSGLKSPRAIILIVIIVLALIFGLAAGAELIARWRAASVLDSVVNCITQDDSDVSFSTTPPFLYQYLTSDYAQISVETSGAKIREAEGMKADVTLSDIRLEDSGDSQGTIGSINATISWTSEGIQKSLADNVPLIGGSIDKVTTDASAGTISIEAFGSTFSAKPTVVNGALSMDLVDVDIDLVKTTIDDLMEKLKDNYPLGIKADSVKVTDTGVEAQFSSQNATIPKGEGGSDLDKCFENV